MSTILDDSEEDERLLYVDQGPLKYHVFCFHYQLSRLEINKNYLWTKYKVERLKVLKTIAYIEQV